MMRARRYAEQSLVWLERAIDGPGDVDDGMLCAAEQTVAATISIAYANLSALAYMAPELLGDDGDDE